MYSTKRIFSIVIPHRQVVLTVIKSHRCTKCKYYINKCQQIKLVVFATVRIYLQLICAGMSGKNIFYICDCSLKIEKKQAVTIIIKSMI